MNLSDQIIAAHAFLRETHRLTGCISFLQRKLGCSYNRASLVLGFLEETGVISEMRMDGYRRWLMESEPAVAKLREMI